VAAKFAPPRLKSGPAEVVLGEVSGGSCVIQEALYSLVRKKIIEVLLEND